MADDGFAHVATSDGRRLAYLETGDPGGAIINATT